MSGEVWFGVGAVGVGALFVLAGWAFYRQGRRLRIAGERVVGTVVRVTWPGRCEDLLATWWGHLASLA